MRILWMLLVLGCTGKAGSGSDTTGDSGAGGDADADGDADGDGDGDADADDSGNGDDPWSLVATNIGAGVLLSAWSDGDTVRMVGGDMAGGPGVLAHYDGETLCTESGVTDRALWWIHGPADGDWYAVGEAGTVLHEKDGVRERMDAPTDATLYGVWTTDTTLIAVGGSVATGEGEVWKYEAGSWTALSTGLPGVVFKVWENWLVGDGIVYQLDGINLIPYPSLGRLLTTRGRAADDVWAVGGSTQSLVVHFDGTAWAEVDSTGVGQPLNGVWTAPGKDVWVTGNFGTTARWDGSAWDQPTWPLTSEHFHAVWQHGDETLFMGGNMFSTGDNYGTVVRHGTEPVSIEVRPCD